MTSNHWLIQIIIYLFLIGILFSLGSALYYLLVNRNGGEKVAKALTFRIGLSLTLFILLLVAFSLGWIKPHGL